MIETVFPAPRSTGVPSELEIWVEFAQPLDPGSVNARNVNLYLDTQVIPAAVSWEATTRRIVLRPLAPLALGRTHTVELEPDLATPDGGRLGHVYFWQFRTTAVCRPSSPFPPDGEPYESPFVTLMWDEVRAGDPIVYDVFVGTDSAAIASRTAPPLVTTSEPFLMPASSWDLGTTHYWSVTVRCPATREFSVGPVWRFDTVPENAPTRTTSLVLSDWTSYKSTVDSTFCFDAVFPVGGFWKAGLRWARAPDQARKLARVTIRLVYKGWYRPLVACASNNHWSACNMHQLDEGAILANSQYVWDDPGTMAVYSDLLTSHVEAGIRHQGFHGYVFSGPIQMQIRQLGSVLQITYYEE